MKIWRWVFATTGWLVVVLAGFGALLIALFTIREWMLTRPTAPAAEPAE